MAHQNGSSTPSALQHQQEPSQQSQTPPPPPPQHHNSYPDASAHSYPSPSSRPAYTYPHNEQHDPSRIPSSMAQPGINLPPIRAIDGQTTPQQQQPPPPPPPPSHPSQQAPNGYPPQQLPPQHPHPSPSQGMLQSGPPPPMHHPVPSMGGYYPPPPPPPHGMHPAGYAPGQPMGYPGPAYPMSYAHMPGQYDSRAMTGGRHKKEIKRRTKTGCLTCRKRRIKCDELHPICRNCQKSKRECLGYDPIFKPQQTGPPPIQPAPGSLPSLNGGVKPEYPHYNPAPEGYPPVGPSPGAPPPGAVPPNIIDPALAMHARVGATAPDVIQVKRIPIEELLLLNDRPIPERPTSTEPLPQDKLGEMKQLFETQYAPELDRLLEVQWYTTNGWYYLAADTTICHELFEWAQSMRERPSDNPSPSSALPLSSIEARVVWSLACLCRANPPSSLPPAFLDPAAPNTTNGATTNSPNLIAAEENKINDVRLRLEIVEALLTARPFDPNRVPAMVAYQNDGTQMAQQIFYEREFWRQLAYAVSLTSGIEPGSTPQARPEAPSPAPPNAVHIDPTLHQLRSILNVLENRDVLYSIAVARFYGPKFHEFPQDGPAQAFNNDDSDPRTKIAVAKKFIEDEASGTGLSQTVQRLCGMAIRSWTLWRRG